MISDAGMESLNGTSAKVMKAMHDLTLTFPNKDYLGKASVSTRAIAKAVGLSLPHVRRVLGGLERRGPVQKLGERLGWALVLPAQEAVPCPA